MDLGHERLDVYHLALDFLVLASEIIEGLASRPKPPLGSVFQGALAIVLNLAGGAGKHSKPDKRRYYLTARGSATESAALLDVCCRLELLEESTRAIQWKPTFQLPGTGTGTGTLTGGPQFRNRP
jgi:four helix bundle protein